jgi:hypothetical protein
MGGVRGERRRNREGRRSFSERGREKETSYGRVHLNTVVNYGIIVLLLYSCKNIMTPEMRSIEI